MAPSSFPPVLGAGVNIDATLVVVCVIFAIDRGREDDRSAHTDD
jgi:hypothetical protein